MSRLKDFEERLNGCLPTEYRNRGMNLIDVDSVIRLAREIWGDSEGECYTCDKKPEGPMYCIDCYSKLEKEVEQLQNQTQIFKADMNTIASLKKQLGAAMEYQRGLEKQLAQAQGKGLSREEIKNILITIEAENRRYFIPTEKLVDALLSQGGIAKKMTVENIIEILEHQIKCRLETFGLVKDFIYPTECFKRSVAQALHSALYDKDEPERCKIPDCPCEGDAIIEPEKPQEGYCKCKSPVANYPVIEEPYCGECLKLLEPQEKVGKIVIDNEDK